MAELDRHRGFLQHMEWADARMWKSVAAIPAAENDERLIALLHHLHLVQWIYLALWRGEAPVLTEPKAYATARAVRDWARPYYPRAAALVDSLDEDALAATVEFPWADQIVKWYGSAAPVSLRETIAQVLLHSTYHRAQIATRVRELGGEPAATDYVAWIWMARPRPEW